MKKPSKNKFFKQVSNSKIVIFILSFILISTAVLFFYRKPDNTQNISQNQLIPTEKMLNLKKTDTKKIDTRYDQPFDLPSSINSQITNLLKKTYSILGDNRDPVIVGDLRVNTSGRVIWTDSNGYTINNENSPSIKWFYTGDFQKYQNNVHQYKLKIIPLVEKVFSDNGFIKQTYLSDNYSEKIQNTNSDSYIYFYEKDSIKCNFVIGKGYITVGNIYINCSDQYEKNYQSQIKILTELNVKNGEFLLLEQSKIIDRYGLFMFYDDRILAMMDANDKWHVLYQGFDPPYCDILIRDKVPRLVMDTCYPHGNNFGPIPNPIN